MKPGRIVLSLLCSAAIITTACHVTLAQAPPPPLPSLPGAPPADAGDEDVEVYTRGTLHEAFATPASNDIVVPPVIQKEPPAAIEELPPEQQPEGDNVTWIAGYWAWDEDLDDYIWISGLWRDVPPGRQWVPGYFAQTPEGYQWVAGMWTEVGSTEISYLPTPPASLERGPQIQAPSEDYFYVPGCWEFHDRYVWRGGYWAPRQREWIWVPAHYVHTPYGCCFVAGHWDLLLVDRGLCYAPVRFHRRRPAYVYRPVIVIDTWDSMVMHLWVDPRRGCYAYGNYYDAPHNHYVPWYDYHGYGGGGHDHLFAYYSWRNGPEYRTRLSGWHNHFVAHRDFRPPATYREHVHFVETHRSTTNININLAIDVRKIDRDRDRDRDIRLPVALKQVSRDDESRYREQAKSWVTAAQTRKQVETKIGRDPDAGKPDRGDRPLQAKRATLELPKAVAVAKKDVPKLDTPDKLKDVKPDKPRGEEVRVPSKSKEKRIAQEQTLKRDRPDPKRADLETPADVPPPPPGNNTGEQASKEDKDNKKPNARDAFGIDTPARGRDNTPERPGRAQGDPKKPDVQTNDPAPKNTRPPVGRPSEDGKKPDMRRDESPKTDTTRPNLTRPEKTPTDSTPKTNRLPSTPNSIPKTDRSLPPDTTPRRADDKDRTNVPRVPNSVPGVDNKSPGNDPKGDRGRSNDRPGKTDNDKTPPRATVPDLTPRKADTTPKASAPPEMNRRDNRPPPGSDRPSERQPGTNRNQPGERSLSNPSVDRKQDSPRAGNQPPKSSTTEPNRRSNPPTISPPKPEPKNERPKATTPERKAPAPKSEKDKKDEKDKEKDKEKKPA